MYSILDGIIENQSNGARIVSENQDTSTINWVRGMSDPGEMISCGYRPELRRHYGESDEAYQSRLIVLLAELPTEEREKIMTAGRIAATRRASLNVSNGRVNMFAAGQLPWHGLGVLVDKAATSAEAIRLAGLDWRVSKEKVYYQRPGTYRPVDDVFAIVREDTGDCLGTVGNRYKPIQNVDGFDFLDGVLAEFGARYESAGALYDGQKVWMLAHFPQQSFKINGDDENHLYNLFTNCHDGTGAAWNYPTNGRVVCGNTYRVSFQDRSKGLSIRHTGNLKDKIKSARDVLGLSIQGFSEFKDSAEAMGRVQCPIEQYADGVLDAILEVSSQDVKTGADALSRLTQLDEAARVIEAKRIDRAIRQRENILEDILERYESRTNAVGGMRGTVWSAFNACSESFDHGKMGKESQDETTRRSRRFESVIGGERDDYKQVAYQHAMALVK